MVVVLQCLTRRVQPLDVQPETDGLLPRRALNRPPEQTHAEHVTDGVLGDVIRLWLAVVCRRRNWTLDWTVYYSVISQP